VVILVGMVDLLAHLRRGHHATDASVRQPWQLPRRERPLSHLQHAAVSGATGLPLQPMCRLQRCPLRWHPVQVDSALRLRRALCAHMPVSVTVQLGEALKKIKKMNFYNGIYKTKYP